jgi:hypothetical protein
VLCWGIAFYLVEIILVVNNVFYWYIYYGVACDNSRYYKHDIY